MKNAPCLSQSAFSNFALYVITNDNVQLAIGEPSDATVEVKKYEKLQLRFASYSTARHH